MRSALGLFVSVILSSCIFVAPVEKTEVHVPGTNAIVSVEVWGNTLSDGAYWIAVQNPVGSVRRKLFEDWGPAQRVNLYLTPQRSLVVLGGADEAEMFSLTDGRAPRWIPHLLRSETTGDDWTYIGAVDGHSQSFRDPGVESECIPVYGSPAPIFRKTHQKQAPC